MKFMKAVIIVIITAMFLGLSAECCKAAEESDYDQLRIEESQIDPELLQLIWNTADKYNISREILESLCWQESSFDINAKSDAGCMGITQLDAFWTKRAWELYPDAKTISFYDPEISLNTTCSLLLEYFMKYPGEPYEVLMAYNEGEKAAETRMRVFDFSDYSLEICERAQMLEAIHYGY